jgi:small conductance mechanosensitive channel
MSEEFTMKEYLTLRDLEQFAGLREKGDFIVQYGQEILLALVLLLVGLILVKLFMAWVRKILPRYTRNQYLISMVILALNILLIVLLLSVLAHYLGIRDIVVRRIFLAVALIVGGFILFLRPYIPTLPFKTGNVIAIEGVVGKVEAMTFNYTRMRTFDGKTLFLPNQKLFKAVINNYHYTPNRRVQINVTIEYTADLLKAKQVMKEIMDNDSRVLKKPVSTVYVMELGEDGVILSGRCWVENAKYLKIRSDVAERIKLRFDEEGIAIAIPQRRLHLDNGSRVPDFRRMRGEDKEVDVS